VAPSELFLITQVYALTLLQGIGKNDMPPPDASHPCFGLCSLSWISKQNFSHLLKCNLFIQTTGLAASIL